jgi:hypothetical protein
VYIGRLIFEFFIFLSPFQLRQCCVYHYHSSIFLPLNKCPFITATMVYLFKVYFNTALNASMLYLTIFMPIFASVLIKKITPHSTLTGLLSYLVAES